MPGREEGFQARSGSFAASGTDNPQRVGEITQRSTAEPKKKPRSRVVDKSVSALPEPRRVRDRYHVRHVAKQSCLVCGRQPADAHHLRFTQSRALGRKVSDEFTVPSVEGIIAKCTAVATKPRGGKSGIRSNRCRPRTMSRNPSAPNRSEKFI
jgi:hypothetical protein